MSKQRAAARAERERQATLRAAAERDRREREVAERVRRERRALTWRRLRLWQHGPGYRRRKEGIAALSSLALVLLVLAYVVTGSFTAVLLIALVLVVTAPVLVMLTFDRKRG